jgi:hypothetical protein
MKNISFILFFFITLGNFLLAQNIDTKYYAIEYWHNQLSQYVNMDSEKVKLAPNFIMIGNTSYSLWNIFNAMSDYNASFYYNPTQYNNFSSAYRTVLYNYPISASLDKSCPLNDAILKYSDANGTYAWNKTIDNLYAELAKSQSMVLTSDKNISIDNSASVHTVKIDAHYQHFLVFYSNPYTYSNNQMPNFYPWYSPCILNKAYQNRLSPYWESTFGLNGYLHNITTALIVAQNGSTCITISNNASESNNTIEYSNCTISTSPFIMAVVISPINDYIQSASSP